MAAGQGKANGSRAVHMTAGQALTKGTQALVDVLGLLKTVSCGFTLAHTLTACMTTAAHHACDTLSDTSPSVCEHGMLKSGRKQLLSTMRCSLDYWCDKMAMGSNVLHQSASMLRHMVPHKLVWCLRMHKVMHSRSMQVT